MTPGMPARWSGRLYRWAAEQIVERGDDVEWLPPLEAVQTVALEGQLLRHRVHEKLLRAFLDPEVHDGRVRVVAAPSTAATRQVTLTGPG